MQARGLTHVLNAGPFIGSGRIQPLALSNTLRAGPVVKRERNQPSDLPRLPGLVPACIPGPVLTSVEEHCIDRGARPIGGDHATPPEVVCRSTIGAPDPPTHSHPRGRGLA